MNLELVKHKKETSMFLGCGKWVHWYNSHEQGRSPKYQAMSLYLHPGFNQILRGHNWSVNNRRENIRNGERKIIAVALNMESVFSARFDRPVHLKHPKFPA